MHKNKKFSSKVIFVIFLQIYFSGLTAAEVGMAGVSYVQLVANVYQLGKATKSYIAPSLEEQAYAKVIDNQLKSIELRKKFITCLINNRTSIQIGSLGIPSQCEQTALLFGAAVPWDEFEKTVTTFKLLKK